MPRFDLATLLPERKPVPGAFPAEYMEMQSMRRAFLRSWDAWLRSGPDQRDIRDEAESTASAFRQIGELNFQPTPPSASHQRDRRR